MKKIKHSAIYLAVICIAYLTYIKPAKIKSGYQPYFASLNYALKKQQPGSSAGIIDIDSLDNNLLLVKSLLGNDYKLRLVTKSLPSLSLLRHLMDKGNTNRLMVFSEPFIAMLLDSLNTDSLDMLLGKPLPADVLPRLSTHKGWNTVHWLVDTKERLNEYLAFAKKENTPLSVSLEIDVGLHRGGFETLQQFEEAVQIIVANKQHLILNGLMGYDGHVPYVPIYINKEKATLRAFKKTQNTYQLFVDVLKKYYDTAHISNLTLNSGGTRTYYRYRNFKNHTPVNDIAMGSGFLSPANFPELLKLGHHPALFLSSPILKKIETSELPHAEKISPLVNLWDPNLKVSYFMLGGGWPGEPVSPSGLKRNTFWDENAEGYSNLLPNQSILSGSDENDLQVGDFVFYQAWEGDGMLTFSKLQLFSSGRLTGEWQTYKGGN